MSEFAPGRAARQPWLPLSLFAATILLAPSLARPRPTRPPGAATATATLRIYFIDVEGGQSTLFVAPTGQSLLVDTGWPDHHGRDADRIVAAAKDAGIAKIDYLLLTHYHIDHTGGVPNLVARFSVGTFIDHGPNRETGDAATAAAFDGYQQVLSSGKYGHITAHPGELLPIRGLRVEAVSADGDLLSRPLPGAGQPNAAACAASERRPADQTENARSLGVLITFGKLRILDLGDLTWDKEMQLMCPANKLGRVDLYVVSHHGWDHSGSPALVDGIRPRLAVMDNGADKGGTPSTWDIIERAPGHTALWQLHYSDAGGSAHNVAPEYIANPPGPDGGHFLRVTCRRDGTMFVFNSRTGQTRRYAPR